MGSIEVLVNNAGITRDGLLIRMKDADWEDVIHTNLSAAFYTTRAAIKRIMKARYGRIINLSSVVGLMGNPGQANYVASKAGVVGLTKAVAKEYGGRGITVNAVAPGFIESDMTAKLPENVQQDYLKQIPASRFGKPEEVAKMVAFLASEDAAYINGRSGNQRRDLLPLIHGRPGKRGLPDPLPDSGDRTWHSRVEIKPDSRFFPDLLVSDEDLDLRLHVEETFQVKLTDSELPHVHTVQDL